MAESWASRAAKVQAERGSDLEKTIHDSIWFGIHLVIENGKVPAPTAGLEAIAQGLALVLGCGVNEGRDAALMLVTDLAEKAELYRRRAEGTV